MSKATILSMLCLLICFTACNQSNNSNMSSIAYAQSAGSGDNISQLASIDGDAITDKDMRSYFVGKAKSDYEKARASFYRTKKTNLDRMVFEKLLAKQAKKKNVKQADLLKKEVSDKAAKVSDADVKKFYDDFSKQMKGSGRPLPEFDKIKAQVKQKLEADNKEKRRQTYFNELTRAHKVTYFIKPPRQDVGSGNDKQSKGNPKAKVVISEFSDFECPYCSMGYKAMNDVMKEFKDQVRLEFRDFPLSFHKKAKPAHNAAKCAGEQGKFWTYHDHLFENVSEWKKSADDAALLVTLKDYAKKFKLNSKEFDACVDGKKFYAEIDKGMQEATSYGVGGTPSFFINGTVYTGGLDPNEFRKVIQEELQMIQ